MENSGQSINLHITLYITLYIVYSVTEAEELVIDEDSCDYLFHCLWVMKIGKTWEIPLIKPKHSTSYWIQYHDSSFAKEETHQEESGVIKDLETIANIVEKILDILTSWFLIGLHFSPSLHPHLRTMVQIWYMFHLLYRMVWKWSLDQDKFPIIKPVNIIQGSKEIDLKIHIRS